MSNVDLLREEEALLEDQRIRVLLTPEPEFENTPTETDETASKDARKIKALMAMVVLLIISLVSTGAAGLDVIYLLVCYDKNISRDTCLKDAEAGKIVASFLSIYTLADGVVSLVCNTFWSSASDRYGRKPIIMIACSAILVAKSLEWYLVFGGDKPASYNWMLLPPIVMACGGGIRFISSVAISYVSDCVKDTAQRTRIVSMTEGCFFGALALSPTIGSFVLNRYGLEALYVSALGLAVVGTLFAAVAVEESLDEQYRKENMERPVTIRAALQPLLFENLPEAGSRRNARIFLACSMLGSEFSIAFMAVMLLYPKSMFNWSAVETGYLVTSMSSTRTLMFTVGFPWLYGKLCKIWTMYPSEIDKIDTLFLRLCLILIATGYLLMGWSKNTTQFIVSAMLDASSSLGMPIMKTGLLKHVDPAQIGTFMAGYNFITSAMLTFLPPLFLQLYRWSFDIRRSLSFETITLLFVLLFLASFLLRPRQ